MELQRYGYTAQTKPGQLEYTYRPLVDVEIGGKTISKLFTALVDSGTDITMVDKSIADLLKIDLTDKETGRASALGKETNGFLAPVTFKVDKFDAVFTFRVFFVENLSHNFEIILGQQDFFQNFNVTFKKSKNKFYLEKTN